MSANPTPALSAEGLRRDYGRKLALDVPHFEVPAGSNFALLGSSGAGKSTLLRVLGLLEKPDAGRVMLDGRVVTSRDREARLGIAMLFQKPYLFAGTVGENVAYGLKARGVAAPERERRSAKALARVGLEGFSARDARALSGGEAQRVALARAIVVEPRVLLLDEPLSFIDPLAKERLTREFAEILRGEHVTAVWVTHDQEEAFAVADRVGILHEGRFVASGPLDEVMALPTSPWTASFLGMEPPIRGCVVRVNEGVAQVEVRPGLSLFGVGDVTPGTEALVAVRPEDVMLFEAGETIPHSSARNRMKAEVVEVVPKGAMVRVVLVCGTARLASLVSRASVAELGLVPGAQVVALFKAAATRVAPLPA